MAPKEVLSPVQEFEKVIADRSALETRLGESGDLVRPALETLREEMDLRLAKLALDETVTTHFSTLSETIQEAKTELDATEATFLEYDLESVVIAKREEIERMEANLARAASYGVKLSGVELELNPEQTEQAPTPPALRAAAKKPTPKPITPNVPAAKGEEGEAKKKPHLNIKIDPNNNISINGTPRSTLRDVKQADPTVQSGRHEIYREIRVDVLEFLIQNQGKTFSYRSLREKVPSVSKIAHPNWQKHITTFFNNDLKYNHRPIVCVSKSGKHGQRTFGILNFEAEVSRTDEVLDVTDERLFTAPDGKIFGGVNQGRLMNKLYAADIDHLFTIQDFVGKGKFYETEQEILETAKSVRSAKAWLAVLVAGVKSELKGRGIEVVSVYEDKEPSQKRKPVKGYYMRDSVEGDPNYIDPDKKEDEPETELSIEEAAFLAAFLENNRDALIKQGLKPLAKGTAKRVNLEATHRHTNGGKTQEEICAIRATAVEKALKIFMGKDDEERQELLELYEDRNDPRYELLYRIHDYADAEGIVAFFKKLANDTRSQDYTFDSSRKGFTLVRVSKT